MNLPIDIDEKRWNLSLIQTKMVPPRPPGCRVTRRTLREKLAAATENTITLIIAPAGFGKTTTLSEWCEALRARHQLVAWLSLDSDDDDPNQFGAYLVASLSRGTDGVVQQAERLLRKDPLTPIRTVISVLLNEITTCGKQIFLILDDFDRLTSNPVCAVVSRLLRYAPDNFHVLVGARGEPKLALTQFEAQGRLLKIDESDLRFSTDDAQAFFIRMGISTIDRQTAKLLNDTTEGWIAGLQLACLSLRETTDAAKVVRDMASNRGGVDSYFNDAVLSRLPPAIYQFLLRTSILDRLNPELCDAVMGTRARSWEKLDWLERHNHFIRALDDERQWFRYHALLSKALKRRAVRQFANELPTLHRRASHWFAAERQWPEAVHHALVAGEPRQAAAWVENCAMVLMNQSDVSALLSLIAKLPPQLVESRPRLRLAKAWALAFSMRMPEAEQVLRSVKSDLEHRRGMFGKVEDEHDTILPIEMIAVDAAISGFNDDSYRALELGREVASCPSPVSAWARRIGETAQIFGLIYDGRFDEVERIRHQREVAHTGGPEPIYASVYRQCMYGLNALVNGHLPEAAVLFESALARAEASVCQNSAAAAVPASYLVVLCYEQNDLSRSWQLINDRSAITVEACPLGSLSGYFRTAARLHARNNDIASALLYLEQGKEIAASRRWLRLRASCDAEVVRLCLRFGWIDRARETADALEALISPKKPTQKGCFLVIWANRCEIKARIEIATGNFRRAIKRLDNLRSVLARAEMNYLEAQISLLHAIALNQEDARCAAFKALENALRYAQSNGMISSFVDEGEPILSLLTQWISCNPERSGLEQGFLDRLLMAFNPHRLSVVGDEPQPARTVLSSREIEILNHIARGLSNKEIGRALRVAPETIKWHLKNIFEKLKVGSRFEAVQRGLSITVVDRGEE